MIDRDWEPAFFAVSAVLGEPLQASIDAVTEGAALAATALLRSLRSTSRETRARAIARAVSELAVAIDAMRMA